MSADLLRRAAALMRERAEDATPGTWNHDREPGVGHVVDTRVSMIVVGDQEGDREDAEHIASWHPSVALAVADWLDRLHSFITDFSEYDEDEELTAALQSGDLADWPEVESALAVARAYLGEQP